MPYTISPAANGESRGITAGENVTCYEISNTFTKVNTGASTRQILEPG